jgi:hypothetical protein
VQWWYSVRPRISTSSASWTSFRFRCSSEDVASHPKLKCLDSKPARAMAVRWRCPPEKVWCRVHQQWSRIFLESFNKLQGVGTGNQS